VPAPGWLRAAPNAAPSGHEAAGLKAGGGPGGTIPFGFAAPARTGQPQDIISSRRSAAQRAKNRKRNSISGLRYFSALRKIIPKKLRRGATAR
jgi:hypothetical protein